MDNMLTVLCVWLCGLVVLGAPTSNCPPGGKYLDKHLGQNGRWQCCSEICEARIYREICLHKCPDYEQKKASAAMAQKVIDQPSPNAADTSAGVDSAPIISIIVLLAVCSVIFLGVILFRRRQQQNGRNGRVRNTSISMIDLQGRHDTANTDVTENLLNACREDVMGGPSYGQEEEADGSSGRSDRTEPKSHVSSPSSVTVSSAFQTAKEEAGPPIQVQDQD